MPTLDEIYRKFGQVSEAAQLIETELGTLQMFPRAIDEGIVTPTLKVDRKRAAELLAKINRQTLGQHINETGKHTDALDGLELTLSTALKERNRLSHHFYREHNLHRNTDAGRAIMLEDLESIHTTLIEAYKAIMLLSGINLDVLVEKHAAMSESHKTDDDGDKLVFHVPI